MGRHLKNTELKTGSYSIRMPYAPSAVGPEAPVDGLVKFNTTTNRMQFYSSNSWNNFSKEGFVQLFKDTFTGDGSTRQFGPLSATYAAQGDEMYVLVFIGNVFQNPGVAFQLSADQITFTGTPGEGQPIVILHGYGNTATI
jgi:hypothetical protein